MPSLPIRCGLVVAALSSLTCLSAATTVPGADPASAWLLRLSLTSPPAPEVEETVSGLASGVDTSYEWLGESHTPFQANLTMVHADLEGLGGWLWGGGLTFGRADITPQRFRSNNLTYDNTSDRKLWNTSIGGMLMGGYQLGMRGNDTIHVSVELTPFIGAGLAYASTENTDTPGAYSKSRGRGRYYEFGARLAAYLTEARFSLGASVSYVNRTSEVEADTVNGGTSKLTLWNEGLGWGLELGYRF